MLNQTSSSEDRGVIEAKKSVEDDQFDVTLRPRTLSDYIGQEKIKKHLEIFLGAAKQRNEPIEHVLLYGPPGLGKTTLAHVIANELSAPIKITSGPAIERAGDLASLLTNLQDHEILFIDELHRLPKIVEEILYPAMEEYRFDIVLGKGPGAKTVRLELPHFTIIGATTRASLLSAPLRDRFGITLRLDYYNQPEISQIVRRSAKILDLPTENDAAELIASRARQTPRIANRLLKRVRDYCEIKGDGRITVPLAKQSLDLMEIDEVGLDRYDRLLLQTIVEKFHRGPVGINSLAAATGEEEDTIAEVYEPYLMQIGFLERTPKGRTITERALKHLKINTGSAFPNRLI